jgi:hypothetical protein
MTKMERAALPRDLGDGLILRRATRTDADALEAFNLPIHSDEGPDQAEDGARVAAWTRDLVEKPHPTFDVGDFTIVEDTASGEIVSSLNIISQTWRYAGIPFGVGRPELVGTHPDYRHRGLVRAQFELIHEWSKARGHMLQAITGIPYFYRKFGYEMALNLGGGRDGYQPDVPKLKDGEQEPYHLRPVKTEDLPFITKLYRHASRRYLVSCDWDQSLWEYELHGKSPKSANRMEMRLIEGESGQRLGFLLHPHFLWGTTMSAVLYELKDGVSWGAVTPSVVRYLYQTGQTYAALKNKEDDFAAFGFRVGEEHPVYEVMHAGLPRRHKPYAWYLRVPDLPGFVNHIAPVLEDRLARSYYCAHSGELKLTFYRQGLRLVIEAGRLATVEVWQPEPRRDSGDAAFPGLTFTQLLFGYRSLEELDHAFADCWWKNDQAYGLLNVLFPKQVSNVYPVS